MLAIRFAELGSTGSDEMSRFHGLSAGKSCLPAIDAPPPPGGVPPVPGGVPVPPNPLDELPAPPQPAVIKAAARMVVAVFIRTSLLASRRLASILPMPPFSTARHDRPNR